jgi:hypothetical protein
MDEKERNQFVDDLLNASLARYSSVTPRPGLEGRILANAKAAKARRTWFVWAGWLAAGAAAGLIALGILNFRHRLTIPAPPKSVEVVKPGTGLGLVAVEPSKQARAPRKPMTQRARPITSVVVRAEVRQAVFPSPEPMTSEEKLLVKFVDKTPTEVLLASAPETQTIQKIQIKELEISPLADEPADSKNKQ